MNVVLRNIYQQGLGAEKCSVVAHDWGGPIAWTFAALHPQMVALMIMRIILMVVMIMTMKKKKKMMMIIISG